MEQNRNFPRNPGLYKTSICDFWAQGFHCQFGNSCWFAHGEHELRFPQLQQMAQLLFASGFPVPFVAPSSSVNSLINAVDLVHNPRLEARHSNAHDRFQSDLGFSSAADFMKTTRPVAVTPFVPVGRSRHGPGGQANYIGKRWETLKAQSAGAASKRRPYDGRPTSLSLTATRSVREHSHEASKKEEITVESPSMIPNQLDQSVASNMFRHRTDSVGLYEDISSSLWGAPMCDDRASGGTETNWPPIHLDPLMCSDEMPLTPIVLSLPESDGSSSAAEDHSTMTSISSSPTNDICELYAECGFCTNEQCPYVHWSTGRSLD